MREVGSTLPLILGGVKSKLVASAALAGAASRLSRGVWASGGERNNTATQQGAAPDRLQLRSFLTSLSAAGELGRSAAARGVAVCDILIFNANETPFRNRRIMCFVPRDDCKSGAFR